MPTAGQTKGKQLLGPLRANSDLAEPSLTLRVLRVTPAPFP
jgi:hypothetical protein